MTCSKTRFAILAIMLICSAGLVLRVGGDPGVHVATPSAPFNVGQEIFITYYTDVGEDGKAVLMIKKDPASSTSLWSTGYITISGGIAYSATAPGLSNPGTYYAGVRFSQENCPSCPDQYAYVAFQVIGASPFDFTIQLTPPSITLEQGETGNFKVLLTYSDPSYAGTVINIQVAGLGPGMNYQLSPTGDIRITTSPSTSLGTYPITIIGSAQGKTHQTSGTITVTTKAPPFDFSLIASPTKETIKASQEASFSITATLTSGTAESVILSAEGIPSGATYKLSTTSGTPTFSSTLTVETSESTPVGEHTITIKGEGGGLQKDTIVTLSVGSAVEPDFEVSSTPTSQTITWEQTATYLLSVNGKGGFSSDVSLAISGLPAGVDSQFNPSIVTPNATSTLTLKPTKAIEAQTYALTIFASGGGKTKSMVVNLIIQGVPTPTTTTPSPTPTPGVSILPIMEMLYENVYSIIIAILAIIIISLAILILRGRNKKT